MQRTIRFFTHPILHTPEAIRDWFQCAGNPSEIAALEGALLDLIPESLTLLLPSPGALADRRSDRRATAYPG